ncbi:ADP-ribosylation factor 1 [Morella rubra]|uniref:ADP-ribosylation factor 1 n=1 Tax=Morella rubra TaxID=262757 RepID=A0A6A1WW50_9ROSI|nr:ADP-ribosylation factor 1 [Morella rubra]
MAAIFELVPLIVEAVVEGAAVEGVAVEAAAVEAAAVEGAMMETALVEGAAVEGAAVEGAAVEAAAIEVVEGAAVEAKGMATALKGFAGKALTNFTMGVFTGGGFFVGTEVFKLLKDKIQGLPVETVESDGVRLTARDVGKNYKEPPSLVPANCVIFVVDSNDRDRISEAREELHRMLGEVSTLFFAVGEFISMALLTPWLITCRGKPLLVFANKKDIPNAMSTSEITAKLGLTPDIGCRWHVQATCGTSGEGLNEGFSWLIENISKGKISLAPP